jgi:hypothetical protein
MRIIGPYQSRDFGSVGTRAEVLTTVLFVQQTSIPIIPATSQAIGRRVYVSSKHGDLIGQE